MLDNLCVNCNENEAVDNFYCFGCGIDIYFSEQNIFEIGETK